MTLLLVLALGAAPLSTAREGSVDGGRVPAARSPAPRKGVADGGMASTSGRKGAADGGTAPASPSSAARRGPADGGLSLAASAMRSPVFIEAEHMEAADKAGKVIWKQNVKVRRQTMTITCDRMIAHYVQVGAQQEVHRVECDGNVKMVDRDRTARGEHADFDNTRGLLEMTGNPELSQANSAFVRGDKVIYDTNKDLFWMDGRVRGVVEGGGKLEKDKQK